MFNANNNFKCINVDFNTTLKGRGGCRLVSYRSLGSKINQFGLGTPTYVLKMCRQNITM